MSSGTRKYYGREVHNAAKPVAAHGRRFGADPASTAGLSRFESCAALHGGVVNHRIYLPMAAGKTARRETGGDKALYLDLAYLFGFIPGVILALFGYCFFVGVLTLITVAICILLFWSMYRYQKSLKIPFKNSIFGFICFLLFFQAVQSTAAVHGYLIFLLHRGKQWK